MINENDTAKIADRIEEMAETPVSEKIIKLLTEGERRYLLTLMYKWTQGLNVKDDILYTLDKGKSRLNKKQYNGTAQYREVNK